MKKIKRLTALLLVFVLVLAAAGCGQKPQKPQTDTSNSGGKELNVACIPGPVAERLKSDAAAFMDENSGIKVNVIEYPEASFETQFPQLLTSKDSKPDVAWFWNTNATYNKVVEAGNLLEPLDDLYASEGWEKILAPSTVKAYTSPDGHKYAVNTDIVWVQIMYYNKKIFDEVGIQEPKTFDELFAAGDKLKAAGYIPLTTGIGAQGLPGQTWMSILTGSVTPEQYDKLLDITKVYDDINQTSPEVIEVWNIIKKMGEKLYPEGIGSMQDDQARSLFVQGKAAMYSNGSWASSSSVLGKELPEDFELGYMFFPQVKEGIVNKPLIIDCNGLVVPKGTGNEDLAKKFVAYVMTYDRQKSMAQNKFFFPSRTDMKPEDLATLGEINVQMYQEMNERGKNSYWGLALPVSFLQVLWTDVQKVVTGTMTPEDAAKDMQNKFEETINQ